MPDSMSSRRTRHETDEVDSDRLLGKRVLHEIVHDRALHRSTLRIGECVEWMSMRLIVTIAYFDEDSGIPFSCYDIDLSSLDHIVRIDDLISLLLEIAQSSELSLITYSTTRFLRSFCHREKDKNDIYTILELFNNSA